MTYSGRRMNTKVAMMHLIHNRISRSIQFRTLIFCPSFGICLRHFNNGTTMSICADCYCEDSRRFFQLPLRITLAHKESIEVSFPIAYYGRLPCTIHTACHRTTNNRFRFRLGCVNGYKHRICIWTPKRKSGFVWRIIYFLDAGLFYRVLVHRCIVRLATITTD